MNKYPEKVKEELFLSFLQNKNFEQCLNFKDFEVLDLNYISPNFKSTENSHVEPKSLFELMVTVLSPKEFLQIMERRPNYEIKERCQSIFLAIGKNNREVIKYLLKKITNFNITQFFRTSKYEEYDVEKSILMDASYDLSPENNDLFEVILNNTKNINQVTPESWYNGPTGNDNAANYAALTGDVDRLELLYWKGANFSNVELYEETTPCEALYVYHQEKNSLTIFNEFMKKIPELLDLELKRRQKMLDMYAHNPKFSQNKKNDYCKHLEKMQFQIELDKSLEVNDKIGKIKKL